MVPSMSNLSNGNKKSFLERYSEKVADIIRPLMPDPLIFAILLTFASFIIVMIMFPPWKYDVSTSKYIEWIVYRAWYSGFWNLLAFSMQMSLMIIGGYLISYHPWVYKNIIKKLASWPKNNKQAALLLSVVTFLTAYIQWGFSLIISAVLAREIAVNAYKRNIKIHYPFLAAVAYSGQGLWHWGLSSSAGLTLNTPGNFLAPVLKELWGVETIPLNMTIFNLYGIGNWVFVFISSVIIWYLLAPKEGPGIDKFIESSKIEEEIELMSLKESKPTTIGEKLDNWPGFLYIMGLIGLTALYYSYKIRGGFGFLDLNNVNFVFIVLAMFLYGKPSRFISVFYESAKAVGGVILQFPFYAGIMGLFSTKFPEAGISAAQVIAFKLANISTPLTWPIVCWFLSAIINVFIPSGGGQFAATGEFLLRAGHLVGAPVTKTAISYMIGDNTTNLLQPFWAIPLLMITGLKARDVMGYSIAFMLLYIIPIVIGLLVMPVSGTPLT